MNKEQVYKELDKKWNLFNMSDNEIISAYNDVTGLEPNDNQTILDLRKYLLENVLDLMIKDDDIDCIMANNIYEEIIERWK